MPVIISSPAEVADKQPHIASKLPVRVNYNANHIITGNLLVKNRSMPAVTCIFGKLPVTDFQKLLYL